MSARDEKKVLPHTFLCTTLLVLVSKWIFSSVYVFYLTSWENLIKQDIMSTVIISFILIACMFDQAEIV